MWRCEWEETPGGVEVSEIRDYTEQLEVGPCVVSGPRQARVARKAERQTAGVFPLARVGRFK